MCKSDANTEVLAVQFCPMICGRGKISNNRMYISEVPCLSETFPISPTRILCGLSKPLDVHRISPTDNGNTE